MPLPAARESHRLTQTVNEQLVDVQARNAFLQESHQNREAQDIARRLARDVFKPTEFRLEEGLRRIRSTPGRPNKTQRKALEALIKRVDRQVQKGFQGVVGKAKNAVFGTAKTEADLQIELLKKRLPKEIKFNVPTRRQLRQLSFQQQVQGRSLNEWFTKLRRDSAAEIRGIVRDGVRQGTGARRIARQIRGTRARAFRDGINAKYQRHAQTLIRTAQNQAMNDARIATYEANRHLFKGYQWVAVLDGRTSDICLSLDGQVFEFGRGPQPPAHHNCRSSVSPVLKSWRELGLKSRDLTTSEKRELDGKPPQKLDAFEWLRRQPIDVQEEALGKQRAKLLRNNTLTRDTIIDRNGKSRTLGALRRLQRRR